MSNIDKRALREVAEKATPGPWLWINTGSYFSFLVPQSNQDPHNCIIDDGSSWGEYGETINPKSPDGVFIAAANPSTVLALLDELEVATDACNGWQRKFAEADERLQAAEKRIAELTESLKQTVSGYKSCLRTGHDRILDLGGDCDAPEVMIAGNPDIQQAEKLLAAAAAKGDKHG